MNPSFSAQIPYALFILTLFFGYGSLVRRGRIAGRAIIGAGVAIGLVAVVASYFSMSPDLRRQAPFALTLIAPGIMAICATFCVIFAYRAQQVVEMGEWAIGDTTVRARYAPAAAIDADGLILAVPTTLRMLSGVAAAIGVASGGTVEKEALASAPAGLSKVVVTSGGRMAVDKIFHAVAFEPLRPVTEANLRKAIEMAAQQARKSGVESLAVPIGALRGMPAERVATITAEAVLKQRRAFSEVVFLALEVRSSIQIRDAIQGVMRKINAEANEGKTLRTS